MKITLLQENLVKIIGQASRFIATKPQIPILSGILMSASNGKLELSSTDLRVGFITTQAVKVDEEGNVVVPAKVFSELINTLNLGAIELFTEDEVLIVKQKKTKVRIPTFPPTEFPPFPKTTGQSFELPKATLEKCIQTVIHTASLDETRPVLASLYLRIDEKELVCACTDGYRLSVMRESVDIGEKPQILLPARSMQEVMGILSHSRTKNVHLSVSSELSQAFINVDEFSVLLRMVEGEFPPFEKIIPTTFVFETILDREEWISALKTAMVFAKDNSQVVNLEFSDQQCRISSASASVGEQEGVIDSTAKTEEVRKIAFNGKFLLDILGKIDSEKIEFKMNDELKPGLILPEGKEYPISVVMPFKR